MRGGFVAAWEAARAAACRPPSPLLLASDVISSRIAPTTLAPPRQRTNCPAVQKKVR